MKKLTNRSRARKGTLKFDPKRDYIQKAINEYLANGGQITFIGYKKESEYNVFINDCVSVSSDVDEFLMGS